MEKYNAIWDKVSTDIKKENLKTKIKSYDNQVPNFYDKEFPKVDSNYTCLAVISLDFALKKDETIIRKYF